METPRKVDEERDRFIRQDGSELPADLPRDLDRALVQLHARSHDKIVTENRGELKLIY